MVYVMFFEVVWLCLIKACELMEFGGCVGGLCGVVWWVVLCNGGIIFVMVCDIFEFVGLFGFLDELFEGFLY